MILVSCVHGRLETVEQCIKLSPEIERLYVYSDSPDGKFLKGRVAHLHRHVNQPLNEKWNFALQKLREIDFDYCVMMGSDDYFDQHFLDFIEREAPNYDMIGFTDMYFKNEAGENFYWAGYMNERRGEPAGAGKVYSKEFLERIDYNLFPVKRPRGLDGQAWVVVNHYKANIGIFSLKEEGLWLCDIKDGKGITDINKINGLIRV